MPVPSQGHCGFPSFPVVDWFCLFVDLWVLPFPLEDCSVFGNFVITLILTHCLPHTLHSGLYIHNAKIIIIFLIKILCILLYLSGIFIFELVQYTFYQYLYLGCKYKDILHDYFPLKLIGKYLLLYNNNIYCII